LLEYKKRMDIYQKGKTPEGSDGQDANYRMIIENRYKILATSRRRLNTLMIFNLFCMAAYAAYEFILGKKLISSRLFDDFYPGVYLLISSIAWVLAYFGKNRNSIKALKAHIIVSLALIILLLDSIVLLDFPTGEDVNVIPLAIHFLTVLGQLFSIYYGHSIYSALLQSSVRKAL
jgi:hypothetical protein